ncbi:HD domain-containing protein [Candidatus Parcubacteria bacterium]|nr:MAG: HD domain-containing protein [Candidatus Parcubacteria bacterium]
MRRLQSLQNEVQKRIQNDPAHDFEHIMRVCRNAKKIAKHENADVGLVMAAALLHDIVSYKKSDKRSKNASLQSALAAKNILKKYGYTISEIKIITDAIRDHSFSQNKVPKTLVGKVLQDADRLDALGAIGIARTFSVGGAENRPIYNTADPFCKKRTPDDKSWTTDHFFRKLLLLEKKMNTKSAKKEAQRRTKLMIKFLANLKKEI